MQSLFKPLLFLATALLPHASFAIEATSGSTPAGTLLPCPLANRSTDIEDAKTCLRSGDYEACITMAKSQVESGIWNEEWPCILIEAYLITGKYRDALLLYDSVIEKFATSLPLRMLGAKVYRMNNMPSSARDTLRVIPELLERVPWRYSGKDSFVVLGEYFLEQGEDPKRVLESCFDRALRQDPKYVPALVASGRLALNKNDGPLATQSFEKALALEEEDPDIYCLAAQAWLTADNAKATAYLTRALELNPRHVDSLLFQAEVRMDSEDYTSASELLVQVENINPRLPKLWALRAAIAHLLGDYPKEGECRRQGLEPWPLNPEVDHLIGKQLAEHYRFEDSARYQRRALDMDPNYLPAQTQLAQDLLRLGSEEGWEVVDVVRKKDPYDVSIFNLKQLQALLAKFATLEAPGLIIRMDAREALIYGDEVKKHLSEARQHLTDKYHATLEEPVVVEIFPRQKEFAVRTFGLPGGEGFLGVCFGRLITANSPSALKSDTNWKSMLWHEYCHVVTLQKTKNKMPRWLSEGISVYEERLHDPRWGQSMKLTYYQFLMAEDLTPVSRLSSSFLRPKSPQHLDFAYFHASLVVQFFVEKFGHHALEKVLQDLGVGMSIEDAMVRHTGSLAALDQEFEAFAKQTAKQWLTDADHLAELQLNAQKLVADKKWNEAKPLLEQWIQLEPTNRDPQGCYGLKALVCRELEDHQGEYDALVALVARCSDAGAALERLIELDTLSQAWPQVAQWCDGLLAIDPLRSSLQKSRALVGEKLNNPRLSIEALQALLQMEPIDPSSLHYRLAVAYEAIQDWPSAKQEVLYALEETPRYQEALALLVRLAQRADVSEASP